MIIIKETFISEIKEIVSKRSPQSKDLIGNIATGNITDSERQELIGLIAAELCENGFDADDEPNSYGLRLEGLIDVLNKVNLS